MLQPNRHDHPTSAVNMNRRWIDCCMYKGYLKLLCLFVIIMLLVVISSFLRLINMIARYDLANDHQTPEAFKLNEIALIIGLIMGLSFLCLLVTCVVVDIKRDPTQWSMVTQIYRKLCCPDTTDDVNHKCCNWSPFRYVTYPRDEDDSSNRIEVGLSNIPEGREEDGPGNPTNRLISLEHTQSYENNSISSSLVNDPDEHEPRIVTTGR